MAGGDTRIVVCGGLRAGLRLPVPQPGGNGVINPFDRGKEDGSMGVGEGRCDLDEGAAGQLVEFGHLAGGGERGCCLAAGEGTGDGLQGGGLSGIAVHGVSPRGGSLGGSGPGSCRGLAALER